MHNLIMQVVIVDEHHGSTGNVIDHQTAFSSRFIDYYQYVPILWGFPKISEFIQIHGANVPSLIQRPPNRMAEPSGRIT